MQNGGQIFNALRQRASVFSSSYRWRNRAAEISNFPRPPYIPYLVPSDYQVSRPIKEALYGRWFATDDYVKDAVLMWLRSQPITFFADGIRRLVYRYTINAVNMVRLCWEMTHFKLVRDLTLEGPCTIFCNIYIYIYSNEIHNVAALIVYWCIGVSSTCFGP